MSLPTLLVAPRDLEGDRLEVEGDAYRHLFRSRRLGPEEELRVVDGRGRARQARVVAVDRMRADLVLGEPLSSLEPSFELELLVAPPRLERAATLVEKATEIGVTAIRFVATERSGRHYGEGNLERLRRVAAAAVQQCGRSRLPEIDGVLAWERVPDLLEARGERFLLAPGGARWPAGEEATDGVIVIGPEGGMTKAETRELELAGCRAVGLGERILRVETAAIAAASLVLLAR